MAFEEEFRGAAGALWPGEWRGGSGETHRRALRDSCNSRQRIGHSAPQNSLATRACRPEQRSLGIDLILEGEIVVDARTPRITIFRSDVGVQANPTEGEKSFQFL
jgi:hypothetical protein